jgi:hypothetical protein
MHVFPILFVLYFVRLAAIILSHIPLFQILLTRFQILSTLLLNRKVQVIIGVSISLLLCIFQMFGAFHYTVIFRNLTRFT